VLAWTAVKMITGEPFVSELLHQRRGAVNALYLAVIGGVLGIGWLRNRRTTMQKAIQKA